MNKAQADSMTSIIPPMTPDELDATLHTLRWGPADLAREARVSENTVGKWRSRKAPIPAPIAATLRARGSAVAIAHAAHPFPEPPPRPRMTGSADTPHDVETPHDAEARPRMTRRGETSHDAEEQRFFPISSRRRAT